MIQERKKQSTIQNRAERTVLAAFPSSVNVREPTHKSDADLVINGHPIDVKWVGKGRLGDVNPLLKHQPTSNVVIVARQLSPGARAALSEAGINWVDESGAAEIVIGTVIVSRSGTQTKEDARTKSWTPAVQAVAEALLCDTKATQSAVQAVTGLSAGSSTNTLRFLTNQGLLSSDAERGPASGRRIVDFRKLLNAYADAASDRQSIIELQIGVTWQDIVSGIERLGRRWEREETAWAVTGSAAAAVMAPYLSTVSRVVVYVDANSIVELEALARKSKLKPIHGGRLTVKPFPTVAARRLRKLIGGLRVAPWPRVYADLRAEGVRGEEAAEHLFEVYYAG